MTAGLVLDVAVFQNQNNSRFYRKSDVLRLLPLPRMLIGKYSSRTCIEAHRGGEPVKIMELISSVAEFNGFANGNPQVEKRIPNNARSAQRVIASEDSAGGMNFQALWQASSRTEDQLNRLSTKMETLFRSSIRSQISVAQPAPVVQDAPAAEQAAALQLTSTAVLPQVTAQSPAAAKAIGNTRIVNKPDTASGSTLDHAKMPEPIAHLDQLNKGAFDFGSEELRVALIAGGERAHHVKCPKCLSDDVRRSSPATSYESTMRLFFASPYSCRKCLSRFYGKIFAEKRLPWRFARILATQT